MSKKNVHHLSWRKSRKKVTMGTNRRPTVSERRALKAKQGVK